ncbi:MAG TPA: acyltransferase [Polyangiaceae bacterium]|jgi:peptidoglycan/LPS O-acetylase OafA/YrhL
MLAAVKKEALRLEYLDGLRAVASLYVVLFHAGVGFNSGPLTGVAHLFWHTLVFGHDAVAIFIVLSGYCLMLPVARAEGQLVRGLQSYFARRAWRILPPYYATVLGSLLLLALVPVLETPTTTIWADTFPAFGLAPIGSHLLLIHNLYRNLANRIDGPLWSVATEWQIYVFFPVLLLPIWRRFGAALTVLVGFALGSSLLWLAPEAAQSAASWYLGLFALGMAAAGIGFASRPLERAMRERVPWGALSLLLLTFVAVGASVLIKFWFDHIPLSDALVGATTAVSLVYLTKHALKPASPSRPISLRVLESAALVAVGRFSYSLYLTHLPVVALLYFGLRRLALSANAQMLALSVLSVPASVLFSYAFFWVFERRFTGHPAAFFGKRAS